MEQPYNEHLGELNAFFEENNRLIHFICHKFNKALSQSELEYDDVFQIAVEGFIKAYRDFNPGFSENGIKFSTYAVPKIQGEVLRRFRDHNNGLKVSRSTKELYFKLSKMGLLDAPVEKVVKETGADEKLILKVQEYAQNRFPTSLDQNLNEGTGDHPVTVLDQIGADLDLSSIYVNEFMDKYLTWKERTIIKMLSEGKTQYETGKAVGVSQVQVSRIVTKRIQKKFEWYLLGEEPGVNPDKEKGNQPKRSAKKLAKKKRRGRRGQGDLEKAKELVKQDMLPRQIEKETGCNINTLRQMRNKWLKEQREENELNKRIELEKGGMVPDLNKFREEKAEDVTEEPKVREETKETPENYFKEDWEKELSQFESSIKMNVKSSDCTVDEMMEKIAKLIEAFRINEIDNVAFFLDVSASSKIKEK